MVAGASAAAGTVASPAVVQSARRALVLDLHLSPGARHPLRWQRGVRGGGGDRQPLSDPGLRTGRARASVPGARRRPERDGGDLPHHLFLRPRQGPDVRVEDGRAFRRTVCPLSRGGSPYPAFAEGCSGWPGRSSPAANKGSRWAERTMTCDQICADLPTFGSLPRERPL